jgi:hypothetical protein
LPAAGGALFDRGDQGHRQHHRKLFA